MKFTMRRSWPDKEDDYVFRVDGRDAGRCYFTVAAHSRRAWLWTTYGGNHRGLADTLEDAQAKFKMAIEAIQNQITKSDEAASSDHRVPRRD